MVNPKKVTWWRHLMKTPDEDTWWRHLMKIFLCDYLLIACTSCVILLFFPWNCSWVLFLNPVEAFVMVVVAKETIAEEINEEETNVEETITNCQGEHWGDIGNCCNDFWCRKKEYWINPTFHWIHRRNLIFTVSTWGTLFFNRNRVTRINPFKPKTRFFGFFCIILG